MSEAINVEMSPGEHRIELEHNSLMGSYTAICTCGWIGQEEKSKLSARKHAEAHTIRPVVG